MKKTVSASQVIVSLELGKVVTYDKGGPFQKSFKKVAGRFYYSFNNQDWNPTFIDVIDKVKKQYTSFTLGGI